jgi:uncharacterized membrane protein
MNDNSQFPLAPAPFDGKSREVDAGACFEWLAQGWAMFIAHPGIWLGSSVLVLVMLMAISIVPLFGQVAAHLLVPLFGAGMLQICRTIADEREPQIAELFAGFRQRAGQLVMVGVFFAIGMFGIALLAFMLISGGALGAAVTGKVAGFGVAFGGIMLAGLLVILLTVPVVMATWFAPALVYFHGMAPLPAMKASFMAGLRNLLPMGIFGIFLVVAGFFAMLPVGLGLLLLLPVFSAAVYASYRDIFTGV